LHPVPSSANTKGVSQALQSSISGPVHEEHFSAQRAT